MSLAEVVLLVFLSVSGVWAQDMAQCEPGYDWVCVQSGFLNGLLEEMQPLNVLTVFFAVLIEP